MILGIKVGPQKQNFIDIEQSHTPFCEPDRWRVHNYIHAKKILTDAGILIPQV